MTNAQREIHRKKRIIEYAEWIGNVHKTCRYLGVARSTFYLWRERYRELGDEGLSSRRGGPHNHPNKTPDEVVDKILHLRRTYHMGPNRIVWYLQRYHDIKTSDATVYRVCKRHRLNRLPKRVGRRAVHTHRYEKRVPGHHVQVDVKFLTLARKKGAPVRRYQYTAIDDATRVRALKIYRRHTQANAIDFIDYVVEKFPSRRHSSEMLCSPRSPSSTIRIFSSGANLRRVLRRISRTAASVDCFCRLAIETLSSGCSTP